MANYDVSIRINPNINPNKINNYEFNTESYERLKINIERIERILTDSINIEITKQSFELLNRVMKDSFSKISSVFDQYDFDEIAKKLRFSLDEMADAAGVKQIEALQNINFSKVFSDSFYHEKCNEASDL